MTSITSSTPWVTRMTRHVGGPATVKAIGKDAGISALFAIGGMLTSDTGPLKDASPTTKKLVNAVFGVPMFTKLTGPELVEKWKDMRDPATGKRAIPDFVMHALTASIGVLGITTNDKEMMQSAAMLAALFAMAGHLEEGISAVSEEGIAELERSIPTQAKRRVVEKNGQFRYDAIDADKIRKGDHLFVAHGEMVPVDSQVVEVKAKSKNSLKADSGAVIKPVIGSGEKEIKAVSKGAHVPQGAIAEGADLVVKSTANAEHSLLRMNVDYLKDAEHNPARSVHGIKSLVNNIYIPILLAACAAQFGISYISEKKKHDQHKRNPLAEEKHKDDHVKKEKKHFLWEKKHEFDPKDAVWEWPLKRTAELAIKMAPCAITASMLVLPFVKNRMASEFGILVREDAALEKIKGVTHVLTDIRGTLTKNTHKATLHTWDEAAGAFIKCEGKLENKLLSMLGKVESTNPHPMGKSIHKAATNRKLNLNLHATDHISVDHGKGVVGTLREGSVLIGNHEMLQNGAKLLKDKSYKIPSGMVAAARKMGDSSYMHAVTADGVTHWGLVTFKDELRHDVVKTIQDMREKNIKVVMVTGMEEHKARHYLKLIDDGSMPHNPIELRANHASIPKDGRIGKTQVVEEFSKPGNVVVAIGDAENDSAFLKRTKELGGIPCAIGLGGVSLTKEKASLVIEGIHQLPGLMDLSKGLNRILWTNVAVAASWMSFLIGTHCFGKEMKPQKASIAHEMPTFLLTIASLWQNFSLTKKLPASLGH